MFLHLRLSYLLEKYAYYNPIEHKFIELYLLIPEMKKKCFLNFFHLW